MRIISKGLVSALLLGSPGCLVEATPLGPSVGQGTVELYWSINRSRDPNQCAQSVVDSIAIEIIDDSGRAVGSYGAVCTNFGTSITLYAGAYEASATLTDGAGRARTTTLNLDPFSIRTGTVLQIPIDFGANSFF